MTPGNDPLAALPQSAIDEALDRAFAEDLGAAGDITSAATIPPDAVARATLGARRAGVIAGLPLAAAAFHRRDPAIRFEALVQDGDRVEPGQVLARVEGNAQAVLAAERVALNFVGHLSGIATATAAMVDRVRHTHTRILDTRKTTPGLRVLEKYAVRCGGGVNHRIGLYDAVLIKDNHIAVAGGVRAAVLKARKTVGSSIRIEVETTTLSEVEEAVAAGADIIMLDNMDLDEMREAVALVAGRAVTEASGNVTLDRVAGIADTGVDTISSGAITHSAPNFDVGLDVVI